MIPSILVGSALLLLFSPWMLKAGASLFVSQPAKSLPTYQSAIADLARVRSRLLQTRQLGDDQKAAIDALTLALVAGSDQP